MNVTDGWTMRNVVMMIIAAAFLPGCRSVRYVPVESHRTDTVYQVKTEHDSIHTRDSVYIHEWSSAEGDTIYVERERWRDRWRERWLVDTLYRVRTDSVMVPYPVEKPLTYWQRFCLDWGKVTTGGTIALVLLLAVRIFWRRE